MTPEAYRRGAWLPWAPRILWPNGSRGQHWARVHTARAKQHRDALILLRAAGFPPVPAEGPVEVHLSFLAPPRTRRYDLDNALASQKAALDALAEALGCDDSRFALSLARLERYDRAAPGGMLVSVGGWQRLGDVVAPIINRIMEGRS